MGSYESTAGIMPSVESWLEGFLNASFVVTDSFHGAVLSILFGKPFVVFGNEKRGIDRFHTLLRPLGLEHRLLKQDNGRYHIPDGVTDLHDLEHAGAVLAELRTRSLGYLQRVLG